MGKGIKLCYLYAEDENGQPLIDVCLDNELDFKWDGNNLNIRKKDNYIERFYGDNINNFNLIIGKNGSGKSTLIKEFISCLYGDSNNKCNVIKVIYYNKYYIQSNMTVEKKGYEIDSEIGTYKIPLFDENYIFFSNQLSVDNVKTYEGNQNISLISLLENPHKMFGKEKKSIENFNTINLYKCYCCYTEYNLFLDRNVNKFISDYFNINEPKKICLFNIYKKQMQENIPQILDILKKYENKNIVKSLQIKLLKQMQSVEVGKEGNKFRLCFFAIENSILKKCSEIPYYLKVDSDYKRRIIEFIEDIIDTLKYDYGDICTCKETLNNILEKVRKLSEDGIIDKYKVENFEDIIDKFKNLLDILDSFKVVVKELGGLLRFEQVLIDIKEDSKEDIKKFLKITGTYIEDVEKYFSYKFYDEFFKEVHFSSGQENILSMYGRIYEYISNLQNKKDYILFMDEPDIYLHPEWQRILMDSLFKFINTVFKDIKIQLIVTTNSPILAGDIPRKDIIMLEDMEVTEDGKTKIKIKDSKKETFGRNLLSLFKDVFFMDSTMGEFSVNKINGILEKIEEFKNIIDKKEKIEKEKSIQSQIDIIAEPLIRRKVQGMFDKVNNKESESIETVIKDANNKGVSIEDISTMTGKSKGEIERILESK